MSHHDEYRELSALRLYGELDPQEHRRLERHLAECRACVAHARELEAGLGRLARGGQGADMPAGWRAGLERELAHERRHRALRSPLWVAAASFLAGATLAWSVAAPVADRSDAPAPIAVLGPPAPASGGVFERSTPPPRARDQGTLPLLELYRGR